MTAFTLTQDRNIDELSGKAGGDTYATAGFKLTIDQDSRTGLNQSASSTLGSMTITATSGGEIHVDGTGVWMIPYTGGAGSVPAWNTVISNGSGSGKLIGVHASLTAASTETGAAMPASGYLRVKQKTGTYAAGALTGISATASDAGRIGWLEIVGDEAGTVNANRLGTFRVTGAWFELGTTTGSSNQTLQIPNNGLLRYAAGVYIEQNAGAGDYEFYPNAGTTTTTGTEAARGKVVWIDNTGLVRIGNSGAATNGYTPASGLAVVVPNIFFENCTTAARTANVIPNATIGSRYDFTATGGGVVEIDKCNMAWYLSLTQAYSVNVSSSCFVDAILLSEIASPMTFTKVGVGNKPTTALLVIPLTMSLCFAGGTFTDCVWSRVSQAASNANTKSLTDVAGFTFIRNTMRANTIRGNATTYSVIGNRVNDCSWENPRVIQGTMDFAQSSGLVINDTEYVDCVSGSTVTTYAMYVWAFSNSSNNCIVSGLTLPVANTHPYTSLLYFRLAGCSNIKLRNIGTRANPLDLGTANACAYIWTALPAAAGRDIKIQRVYCKNTRSGTSDCDNSFIKVTEDNVGGDAADNSDILKAIQHIKRGYRTAGSLTAQQGVYGSMFHDRIRETFPSTFVSAIYLSMNEPTSETADQVTLENGAAFTSSGGLYMPTIGMSATFTCPYYVLGHTGFKPTGLYLSGGAVVSSFYHQVQIDINDGNGFSAWSEQYTSPSALSDALIAMSGGIDPSKGFKLRYKITTRIDHAQVISTIYFLTESTLLSQDYQYPLDENSVTFTGLPTGCDAVTLVAGTTTILDQKDSMSGTSYNFVYSGAQVVDVGFIKPGYVPFYIRNLSLTEVDSIIPVSLSADRNYQ